MTRDERIQAMNTLLNQQREVLKTLNDALDALEAHRDDYATLIDYYYSDDYFVDLEAADNGEISEDISQEVVSEDAIYNVMVQQQETSLRLLEQALANLRQP